MPEFASISLKDVPVESDIFEGMKFCMLGAVQSIHTLTLPTSDISRPKVAHGS